MASYVPPGGTLVDTDSQNEGTSLGKPVSRLSYARMFELSAAAAAQALDHAREAAVAAGWTTDGDVRRARLRRREARAASGRRRARLSFSSETRSCCPPT